MGGIGIWLLGPIFLDGPWGIPKKHWGVHDVHGAKFRTPTEGFYPRADLGKADSR